MSQHDFNIGNQLFPATRTDLNNALIALASNSSGASAPATTYANQFWYETDTNKLQIRNEANSAWITIATLDQSGGSVQSINTSALTLGGVAISATSAEINQLDAITRGSILYGNASGATARLAKGAAAQVLTSNGTDISWSDVPYPSSGALELIATLTASNSTTLTFTGFNGSTYGSYLFKFNIVCVNNFVNLVARVSTDGGSSYLSGSSDYYSGGNTKDHMEFSGGSINKIGDLTCASPESTITQCAFSSYISGGGAVPDPLANGLRNSYFLNTTAINAIQFYLQQGPSSGGNFSVGTIRVYGFKK